ncbi:di-trans,poly-cis-decaprenylcistransferase [Candidatus Woesearchaeota archaeon]|nr:di-trans,poly-cis-decaprenylcistransferase [Candidatus Woesearchaeota archaeon]
MLEKVKEALKKKGEELIIKIPQHIAITVDGIEQWAKENKKPLEEANKESFFIIKNVIKSQVRTKIPILTFFLLPEDTKKDTEQFTQILNAVTDFFKELINSRLINENKIKVSVLGKWYDLPDRVVESIKAIIEETKDYDFFFVNFCINYSGQEEIVDACRLIARQVKADKLDPDAINKETIKENIYTSYFVPPDLIIRNGNKKETTDLLLWDSAKAKIFFTEKLWPEFDKTILMDAINEYQK